MTAKASWRCGHSRNKASGTEGRLPRLMITWRKIAPNVARTERQLGSELFVPPMVQAVLSTRTMGQHNCTMLRPGCVEPRRLFACHNETAVDPDAFAVHKLIPEAVIQFSFLPTYKHDELPQATMIPRQLRHLSSPSFESQADHPSSNSATPSGHFFPSRPVQNAAWKTLLLGSSSEAYSFSQSSAYL